MVKLEGWAARGGVSWPLRLRVLSGFGARGEVVSWALCISPVTVQHRFPRATSCFGICWGVEGRKHVGSASPVAAGHLAVICMSRDASDSQLQCLLVVGSLPEFAFLCFVN